MFSADGNFFRKEFPSRQNAPLMLAKPLSAETVSNLRPSEARPVILVQSPSVFFVLFVNILLGEHEVRPYGNYPQNPWYNVLTICEE